MTGTGNASAMETAFELDGISKSFAGVHALRDVKFDVHGGEVHALLGENGAGKSTLIKIMSGVHAPDSGDDDARRQGRALRVAARGGRAGIATVYQELLLFPELTVAENIFLGHAPRKAWRRPRLGRDAVRGRGRCSTISTAPTSTSTRASAACRSPTASASRSPRRCRRTPVS